jgi:predicted translin family RNA/ssDNA-binding protein
LKQVISSTIAIETEERFSTIMNLFNSVSPDLQGINAWRYQRQVSAGLQEYMEALSFEHYLRNQSLITHGEASKFVPAGIDLSFDDYILGVFDLVGELMRFAITAMATEGSLPVSKDGNATNERTILMDMRLLRTYFESLDTTSYGGTGLGKDVEKKMEVMKSCVEKVEAAVYGMIIRGRERPRGWVPDMVDDRPSGESY